MPDLYPPLEGETLMAYLVRTRPQYEWDDADGTSEPVAEVLSSVNGVNVSYRVRPRLLSAEWSAYVSITYPPPVVVGGLPPVWPGLEGVQLGEPVALAPEMTVAEDMCGVLIAITAVPSKTLWFTYDDHKAYRHTGALAFYSDNGDLEPFQALSFDQAIYTCRTMEMAAGVKVMVPQGTEGTLTPWRYTLL